MKKKIYISIMLLLLVAGIYYIFFKPINYETLMCDSPNGKVLCDDIMLLSKDIIQDDHPNLRKESEDVPIPLTNEDKETLELMQDYLKNSQNFITARKYRLNSGIGLSAPQININKNLIAINTNGQEYVLANPKIISHSEDMTYFTLGEGCLSVNTLKVGWVPRYKSVVVEGYDLENNKITIEADGTLSIVLQHEIDHLHGVLFYDNSSVVIDFRYVFGVIFGLGIVYIVYNNIKRYKIKKKTYIRVLKKHHTTRRKTKKG